MQQGKALGSLEVGKYADLAVLSKDSNAIFNPVIPAMLGGIGLPGGGFAFGHGSTNGIGVPRVGDREPVHDRLDELEGAERVAVVVQLRRLPGRPQIVGVK